MEKMMSTKCSLAHSREPGFDFHLYHECFDDDNVYLELCGKDIEYEAHNNSVMVRIPLEIWEVIRHCGEADVEFAEWSDEEIKTYVEDEVNRRLGKEGLEAFCGCMMFGMITDSKEEQLKRGTEYYMKLRDTHLARKNTIKRLKEKQR